MKTELLLLKGHQYRPSTGTALPSLGPYKSNRCWGDLTKPKGTETHRWALTLLS